MSFLLILASFAFAGKPVSHYSFIVEIPLCGQPTKPVCTEVIETAVDDNVRDFNCKEYTRVCPKAIGWDAWGDPIGPNTEHACNKHGYSSKQCEFAVLASAMMGADQLNSHNN